MTPREIAVQAGLNRKTVDAGLRRDGRLYLETY